MLNFKKELEKSERQREELSDHLEVNLKNYLFSYFCFVYKSSH